MLKMFLDIQIKIKILAATFVLFSCASLASDFPAFNDSENISNLYASHHFRASLRNERVVTDYNVYRSGSSSVRLTLFPGDCSKTFDDSHDDCSGKNERVDLALSRTKPSKSEIYTFSLKVDESFKNIPYKYEKKRWADVNLFQLYRSSSGACHNVFYSAWKKKLAIDDRCTDKKSYNHGSRRVMYFDDINPEEWNDFAIKINWSSDADGSFELFINRKRYKGYSGVTVIPRGSNSVMRPHIFIYKYGQEFSLDDKPIMAWFDNIGVYKNDTHVPAIFLN